MTNPNDAVGEIRREFAPLTTHQEEMHRKLTNQNDVKRPMLTTLT